MIPPQPAPGVHNIVNPQLHAAVTNAVSTTVQRFFGASFIVAVLAGIVSIFTMRRRLPIVILMVSLATAGVLQYLAAGLPVLLTTLL